MFNQEVIAKALELFWKGMLAIIIGMLVIMLASILINILTKNKKNNNKE